ncbi:hypothetical protein H8D29_00100 [PVC group bacterium]|nr:hypothetical protein [PVC group bacterium]
MNKKKLNLLFELLDELYLEEEKKIGTAQSVVWAEMNGSRVYYSALGKHSDELKHAVESALLGGYWKRRLLMEK